MGRDISIKPLRRRLGLTQKALADALGVHANTVARWERGELGIAEPMVDRIKGLASARRSGTAVTRLSAVTLDPHHEQILDALNRKLDAHEFEACAASLLSRDWKLVPVRGGVDDGFDGAVADATGEPFPLITTTGAKLVPNLSRSLDQAERKGWRPSRALFATSRRITPKTRKKLLEAARARGVTLLQAYDQDWFAQRLYREPEWCGRLLGVTGRPAALSLFPVTRRPLLGDDVLGREREIRWLLDQAGDCLVVGEPGSGKTFLLRSLALQGHARFLVDDDRTQIANDVRSLHPAAVIVDDAHVNPARIAQLDQIRSEVGAKFRIIATSWPGAADAVRSALKVGSTAELRLVRIDADTMVELLKSIGIWGPDRLLYVIQKQAAGRPGLAATLAHLCLTGNVRDVFSGESMVDELARGLGRIMDTDAVSLLAPFALGGATGVRQVAVSQLLGRSPLDVSRDLATLGAAGVIREGVGGTVSVEPDPMRWTIVKRVFYDRPGGIEIAPFLDIVEKRQDALHTLIGARSRGAAIPDLEHRLAAVNSPQLWSAYARLGPIEARYALGRHPEFVDEIAQPALLNAPETAIPMLLDRMVDERGATGNSSQGSVDQVKKWVTGISPDGDHDIERRFALVRATVAWWARTRHGEPAVRVLCLALTPGFSYSVPDPGVGTTVSHRSQMLGDEQLQALIERWPAVLDVMRESERVPWRELFELVRTWLVPQASFFPPVRFGTATDKILRNFAGTMLQGMAGVSRQHPGIQHRIGELARRIRAAPELSLHPEFEVLYPSKPLGVDDWERRHRSWSDALARLADHWSDRALNEVASFLRWCEYEADLAGIDRPRLSAAFCVHLAESVSDPVATAAALVDHALPSALVAPFLRKAAADGHPGWTGLARRCLEEDEYCWSVVETVLVQRAVPSELFGVALSRTADMPHLEDFVECSCSDMPEAAVRAMLQSNVPRTAAAAAVGCWLARRGAIPESLRAPWRRAVLRSAQVGAGGRCDDYLLGEILSKDSDLAAGWLASWLTSNLADTDSPAHWMMHDVAKTAAKSLPREQRKDVLTRLVAVTPNFAVSDVIKLLVNGDLDLFRQLLDSETPREHHLDPLAGDPDDTWRKLAVAALDYGYSTQEVLSVTIGRSRSWKGPESKMWAGERCAYAALLNDPDDRISEIGRAGVEYMSAQERHAIRRETEEAIYGIN